MQPPPPPTAQRIGTARWVAIDTAAAALLVLVAGVLSRQAAGPGWPGRSAEVVVIVISAVAAGLRRRFSPTLLALVVIAGAAVTSISDSAAPLVAVGFAMYLIPQRLARRKALWLLIATLVEMAVGITDFVRLPAEPPDRGSGGLSAASLLLIVVIWTIGYAVRQQRLYVAAQREQAEQKAHGQLAEARRAMGEERLQIARELHDVIAHTLSVIAVQAGVANHVAAERPQEAHRAVSSIEETSRGALREMRALLGVLRSDRDGTDANRNWGDGGPIDPRPAQGLQDLGILSERTAKAGVRVDVEVLGDRPDMSPGMELAAYRVVQEAVTNVIKHAVTDHCRVTIDYRPDAFTVEVTDDGPATIGSMTGHGIAGMRERVDMYGGEFRAGPRPGRGFQVVATFPLTTTAPP